MRNASASDLSSTHAANDRFKRGFETRFWNSMIAATLAHAAVLMLWPNLHATDLNFSMEELTAIELPPEIRIPPPPEQIQRPANPIVSDAQIDEDITITPMLFEDRLAGPLTPPPTQTTVDLADQPYFTPREVNPQFRNLAEFRRLLERAYPQMLRNSGIGGTVTLNFFINTEGAVEAVQLAETSGYPLLDEAALRVAPSIQFSPALNRDEPVAVWVAVPIVFTPD